MTDEPAAGRAPKRLALNMKATPELRGRVEAAAKASGLSIAQEVERRLIASMAEDDRAGGLVQGDVLRTMQLIMNGANRALERDWWLDPDGWKIVAGALGNLLRHMEPDPVVKPEPFDAAIMAEHAERHREWMEAHVIPLRTRRNELTERRRERRRMKFTEADEAELASVVVQIRELMRSGGPKPALPPSELAQWEVQQRRQRQVQRAYEITVGYRAPFFGDNFESELSDGD
ncbi:hypothetical protein [Sphingomonas sp. Leaf230]|uniref:hypothetical protein n=1 Tax=Sphingomonas sp. Leaf230 TaxID=1735694 RepID=UPI000AB0401F|nr:hypothetical protein [Sphingomonas sp. Leaf230]